MDADTTARFATLLQANREALTKHWRTATAAKLRGRQTEARAGGSDRRHARRAARGRLRAPRSTSHARRPPSCARCSPSCRASRARQGFTADRDRGQRLRAQGRAVREPCDEAATPSDAARLRGVRRVRRRAGLFTFESLRPSPRGAHRRPGRAAAGAVHPGGQAVGGRRRRAAGRHARLGPRPGGHGAAAADAGRHRLAVRDHRHHRRARRSTPRSPSTSSRPWWPPG